MSISKENNNLTFSRKTESSESKQYKPSSSSFKEIDKTEPYYESEASYILGYN
ncbi:hypothetical protein AADZ86_08530 [Colwelliaceae bacterium BS250]